jgi:hypothetical protein
MWRRWLVLLSFVFLLTGCPSIPKEDCTQQYTRLQGQAIRDAVQKAVGNVFDDEDDARRIVVTIGVQNDGSVSRVSIKQAPSAVQIKEAPIKQRLLASRFVPISCGATNLPLLFSVPVKIVSAN